MPNVVDSVRVCAQSIICNPREGKGVDCGAELVFPGCVDGQPLANMVFLMALRRMVLP